MNKIKLDSSSLKKKTSLRKKSGKKKLVCGGGNVVRMPSQILDSLYPFNIIYNVSPDITKDYPLGELLGKGSFGKVYISTNLPDFVIKFSEFKENDENIYIAITTNPLLAILAG